VHVHTDFDCYVIGCHERPIMGAVHKRFGRVLCCAQHAPSRGDCASPFAEPGASAQRPPSAPPDAPPPAPIEATPAPAVPTCANPF
jgi:hypothetical protein